MHLRVYLSSDAERKRDLGRARDFLRSGTTVKVTRAVEEETLILRCVI